MATEKQENFIHSLLTQLGYNTPKLHEKAFEYVTQKADSRESSSDLIEKLLAKLELRRKKKNKTKLPSTYSPTGLAEFVFCPASYSIQKSFYIPENLEEESGNELHGEHRVEEFLKNLFNKRKEKWAPGKKKIVDSEKEKIYQGKYGDLLSSKIIHKGHTQNDKNLLFSEKGRLVGNPDYIFLRQDGSKFVVEEKHTWQDIVRNPWQSNIVQVLAYIYGFKHDEIEFTKGYIIYFPWVYFNYKKSLGSPRIFEIKKNKKNQQEIIQIFKSVREFRNKKVIPFETNNLNPLKCLRCSSSVFCNHKAGNIKVVKYPYYL